MLEEAVNEMQGTAEGTLTIHATHTFASHWLARHLGIFQLDNLLKHKLKNSTIVPYIEVVAQMEEGTTEKRLFEIYTL